MNEFCKKILSLVGGGSEDPVRLTKKGSDTIKAVRVMDLINEVLGSDGLRRIAYLCEKNEYYIDSAQLLVIALELEGK